MHLVTRNWVRDAIGFVEARELFIAASKLIVGREVIVDRREILRGVPRPHCKTI